MQAAESLGRCGKNGGEVLRYALGKGPRMAVEALRIGAYDEKESEAALRQEEAAEAELIPRRIAA
jgi:hypothetical protein